MILVDTSVWIDYFNAYVSREASFLTLCIAQSRPIVLPGLVLTETLQG
ncbi:MAG: PIN domain nuclease, partial [Gammaproteobacteria bacterium]